MKRLLIATAALGLMTAGAAFAQDSQSGIGSPAQTAGQPSTSDTTTTMPAKPTDAVRSAAITPQSTGTPAPAIVDTGTGTPAPDTSATSPAASDTPMPASSTMATAASSTGVVGDMTTANPPPAAGAYPACTHRGQDRCMVTAQNHHRMTARSTTRSGI